MFSLSVLAQSASERAVVRAKIKPLEIGDTIPNALWEMSMPVVNHPSGMPAVKLSDYRDHKLIILDFWATWCGACIANMPRADKLESQIDGVVFIPITYESSQKASSFIKSNDITDSLNIFSIVDEKDLSKFFPHKYLPHYVWISTDGVVRAITGGREVSDVNINRMLNTPNSTNLPKEEEMTKNRVLLISADVIGKGLEYYSIFIKGIRPEFTTKLFQRSRNETVNGRCYTNASLLWLYLDAARELFLEKGIVFNETTDILIQVRNPEYLDFKFTGVDKRNPERQSLKYKWEENNLYSYDVILPVDKASQLYEHIISQINDSTPYTATIAKQKIGNKEKFKLIIKSDCRCFYIFKT